MVKYILFPNFHPEIYPILFVPPVLDCNSSKILAQILLSYQSCGLTHWIQGIGLPCCRQKHPGNCEDLLVSIS
jgi:hypothetical protein